jgi:hypothetical protein
VDYKTLGPDILVKKTTGFNVGIVADLKLQEYIIYGLNLDFIIQRDLSFPGFSAERCFTRSK